jgi:cytochrome b6-f complex iron-sulfur subunit
MHLPMTEITKNTAEGTDRRGFLTSATTLAMTVGLLASYGSCFAIGGRYLYPAHPGRRAWQYVADVARMSKGDQVVYRAPSGESIVVARQGVAGNIEDFIALSDTCPHLGCKVHWEDTKNRFFCPCHNGTFDAKGKGTGGPPGDASQELFAYDLKIGGNMLFINAPMERLI